MPLQPRQAWLRRRCDEYGLRLEALENVPTHFYERAMLGLVRRDEQIALDHLRGELTRLAARRARDHLPLVRETGRRSVETFVERWLLQRFTDGKGYRARVRFADEPTPPPLRAPELERPGG